MYEEEDFDENLIVSTKTEYDGEENVLRPKTMAGPLVILIATPISAATICASVVLPSPGGPYNST